MHDGSRTKLRTQEKIGRKARETVTLLRLRAKRIDGAAWNVFADCIHRSRRILNENKSERERVEHQRKRLTASQGAPA